MILYMNEFLVMLFLAILTLGMLVYAEINEYRHREKGTKEIGETLKQLESVPIAEIRMSAETRQLLFEAIDNYVRACGGVPPIWSAQPDTLISKVVAIDSINRALGALKLEWAPKEKIKQNKVDAIAQLLAEEFEAAPTRQEEIRREAIKSLPPERTTEWRLKK